MSILRLPTFWMVLGVTFLVAFALPVQESGCTQTSHLALTRALTHGTARIDRWQATTCDKAWFGNHFYSVKAPGLAAASLPMYLALRATHLLPHHDTTTIWLLNLFTVVPSLLLLLYLVARVADAVSPGSGPLAAVALGVGSLALPFGTLWFGHVPAACLGFAAFVILFRRRSSVLAGVLAGGAVLFEYPLALLAIILVAYAWRSRGLRSAAAYLAGAGLPAALLLGYNAWAFGSATHFSYEDAVAVEGQTGHDVIGANAQGFFGITWPSPHAFAELLVSPRGLLTVTPVVAIGILGILALRRQMQLEAAVVGSAVLAFFVYNAGYTANVGGPFGGDSPGPRFLIAVLPFLAFPLDLVRRSAPGVVAALLGASVASMLLATSTVPMVGDGETSRWLDGLRNGRFTHTAVSLLGGGSGWTAIAPFAIVVIGIGVSGVVAALAASRFTARSAFEAACALVCWLLIVFASSRIFERGHRAVGAAALAMAAVAAGAGLVGWRARREGVGIHGDTAARSLR